MAKRCYYEVLGVQRDRDRGRDQGRVPQARDAVASGSQSRRQGLRAPVQGNQRGLRRPQGRATSAPPMTASAMPPSSRAWAAARTASAPISARPSPTSSKASSAWAAARPAHRGPRARRRPALQHGDHARGGLRRQDRADAAADLGHLRGLLRHAAPRPAPSRRPASTATATAASATPRGFFTLERTCPICQGRGQVIEDPCPSCSGSGRVTRERTLSVNIPPGVEDGTRIRLAGEGEAGVRGGPSGDLYIFLSLGRACVLPARRRRPALPRAGLDGDGGARRRVRGADHRRRQDAGEGSGGHPVGPALPPAPARACRCCAPNRPATCTCRSWSRRRRT